MKNITQDVKEFRDKLKTINCRGLKEVGLNELLDETLEIREVVQEYFSELGLGRACRYSINEGPLDGTITFYFDWGITRPERTYRLTAEGV